MADAGASALSAERPFPGLRPFGSQDRDFFFGREAQFLALYRLLNLSRFLAVIGNSGSGKSSLVRAGLLPLLDEENKESTSRKWRWVEMRPGDAPLQSLNRAMSKLASDLATTDDSGIAATRDLRISHHLRGSSHGIVKAVAEMDQSDSSTIVLLVDQFEELFRFADPSAGVSPQEGARLRDEAAQFVQLLLEASRSSAAKMHVIITLRSDFIGDCARFQGLPEVVSGTQFLVPSLTRDRREEVITKPFAKVGATIEPALVEQLLNDSGDEMDQLPVLQDCLLRLWELAGRRTATDGEPGVARHVTADDYRQIHGMAGALSQHADEIISEQLPGLDLPVAAVFRALSDVDRGGRATRRAIPFRRLMDETGVDEQVLRKIVDVFRADGCSFLTPSPTSMPVLASATRLDVGHEALLRHWERVSGAPGATGERADPRPVGWLKEEYRDGQRYQALLALATTDDTEGTLLSPEQLVRYRNWWNERQPTKAWAERYGGGHERVVKLLDDSWQAYQRGQAAEQRSKRRTRVVSTMGAVVLFGTIVGGYFAYEQYHQAQARSEEARQISQLAVGTISRAIDAVQDKHSHSEITSKAKSDLLAEIAREPITVTVESPPEVMALAANFLVAFADALSSTGQLKEWQERAELAGTLAAQLVTVDPSRKEWQRLVYASAFRIGDALLSGRPTKDEIAAAVDHYQKAVSVAAKLSTDEPERSDRLFDLAFAHNKVGEGLDRQRDHAGSLQQFETALAIAKKAASLDESNIGRQSYVAATYVKIGNSLKSRPQPDLEAALANYSTAISMLTALLEKSPDSRIVKSNLASARRAKGDVHVDRWQDGDYEIAVEEYAAAVSGYSSLHASDETNTSWLTSLAPTHVRFGRAYEKAKDLAKALAQYESELEIRTKLAAIDPTNKQWLDHVAAAKKRVAKIVKAIEEAAIPPPDEAEVEVE